MKKIALRTPDNRFDNLPDYSFTPHYLFVDHPDYQPLRMHYVDEVDAGAKSTQHKSSPVVLLLHGCPTWSYLYRHVINTLQQTEQPALSARIIAPDFIGCGKSDKMLDRSDYSYDFYVSSLKQFIEQLDLKQITIVCQDWGGPIGLRVFSEMPERFAGIIASNTLLPNCDNFPAGVEGWPGETIRDWVNYTKQAADISISQIVQGVTLQKLSTAALAAYDAPFPDVRYKQGMLAWPSLIPLDTNYPGVRENRRAWDVLEQTNISFITAFSDQDPSTIGWEKIFQRRVKGAHNREHYRIKKAAHMVQEDNSSELIRVIRAVLLNQTDIVVKP